MFVAFSTPYLLLKKFQTLAPFMCRFLYFQTEEDLKKARSLGATFVGCEDLVKEVRLNRAGNCHPDFCVL